MTLNDERLTDRAALDGYLAPRSPGSAEGFSRMHPEYPQSWYCIAWSGDVKPGRAVPLRVLERDVVLWRDSTGLLHCQGAHCPHLGAHLGYGGQVVEGTLRCPFHGWRFRPDGAVCLQPGVPRVRTGPCLPSYRIVERYGAVFLWNGADEPDIEFTDVLAALGFNGGAIEWGRHRWFLPFPAKWIAENLADAMHFAILHDSGGYGDTAVVHESATALEVRNVIYEKTRWFGWDNVKRRYTRGELVNMLTPATADIDVTFYGPTLFLARFAGRSSVLGSVLAGLTPVDAHSCYLIDMPLMPRLKAPIVGPVLQRLLNLAMALGNWSTIVQDSPVMVHRNEPPKPAYTQRDRGLVAYRRYWDARVGSAAPLTGDNLRNNGARAGIRIRAASEDTMDVRSLRTENEDGQW